MITVEEPGVLTSVQDPIGRVAWRHLGVPVGGAADPWSARLANRLVGNPDDAALLEMTLAGPTLRFEEAAAVALTGPLEATVDGLPMAPNVGRALRPGAVLRVTTGAGARGYLAVAGGLNVERVLGSASTDLRTGFGGHEGRALRGGDRLRVADDSAKRMARWVGSWWSGPIRVVAGPHHASLEGIWRIGSEADRTGCRLDGRRVEIRPAEVPSMGLPLGAIQLPPDGRPIIMLADRPVTGGYPVPACVIRADIGRVAQLRSGDEVSLASVSSDEARDALHRAEDELAALEALDAPSDDELGWIGSHR